MADLTGQVALITGASRGIGAQAARAFVQAGAKVVLVARSAEAVCDVAAELGEAAYAVPGDVCDAAVMRAAAQAAVTQFGRLDILVNNAGVIEPIAGIRDASAPDWARAIDINLTGVFNGMQAALAVMDRGTILTVSSGAAHNPHEGWSAYCASKAGAAMLTRSLHLEEAARGIRAMGLSPGTVATQMQRDIKASGVGRVAALEWDDHIPDTWPAAALVWMCSAAADPYLGQEISLRDAEMRAAIGLVA
ncbi:Glucose 1-dehydrogenase [Aquimixticola soesokkakensis]|uniref:Glucose 1-dehydrogenase n=1 Tax=Aquimixticola soesokkakensis TaxID=1519096 RepID=A0A1Y5TPU2_9RHOB|nr:SDR family oxidoreductase [Aquimixticola soesokkakensis]SLN68738.1 Glucose 1-dehydrogenase [Aquimixticola soesokkakensis]